MAKTSSPLADTWPWIPTAAALLAEVLPPLIHVDGSSSEASTIRWLLDQLVKEVTANRPGAVLASKQLAQLLFVQIIRFYLAASEPRHGGVAPSTQRRAHRTGVAPHAREPGRAWRLGELAKQVGMSRTSFALRFKANAGVAPLTYLQNLRMRLAEQGFVTARCRSPSWPSPWATNQTARSATRSSGEPAWHPSTINPSSHGWTSHIRCGRSESTARILSDRHAPASTRHRQTVRRH